MYNLHFLTCALSTTSPLAVTSGIQICMCFGMVPSPSALGLRPHCTWCM